MPELDPRVLLVAGIWLLVLAFGSAWWLRWQTRQRSRSRVFGLGEGSPAEELEAAERDGWLERKLALAGFPQRGAAWAFLAVTALFVAGGSALALALHGSALLADGVRAAEGFPGGGGELAAVVLVAAPWLVVGMLALLPWSFVSGRRKRRVQAVEQDLPVLLELFATMSEAGMGFDAALARVLEAVDPERPFAAELVAFRTESLAGLPRVTCFRRMARRLEVPAVSIFASALVMAEQVGAGFAGVLRTQADDLRNRRREQANSLAQTLPVKLVFPLVLCFMPGIFVATLGPTLLQFVQLADSLSAG